MKSKIVNKKNLLVLFVSNSVVIFLASLIFPSWVVLGNYFLPFFLALFFSMAIFSFYQAALPPFIKDISRQRNIKLSPNRWSVIYFFVNSIGLWIMARLANVFGLGISSWTVVVALAIILSLTHSALLQALDKK